MNTAEAAKHKWHGILTSMGIDAGYLSRKHTPCPLCGGKDRFRYLDFQGNGTWVCNQCCATPSDGFGLLMRYTGQDFATIAKEIDSLIDNIKDDKPVKKSDPKPRLDRLAKMSRKLTGTDTASAYLQGRGLTVQPINVRYAPEYGYYEAGKCVGKYPVMIARVQDAAGKRVSFHVTYLADVPQRKKILPPDGTITGCGIYLGPAAEHMIIGEGIETTLAGMQMHGLPGIAAISAGGMERLALPEIVKDVKILADADENFTGQKAAYTLANKLAMAGISIEVLVPAKLGTDFADMIAKP